MLEKRRGRQVPELTARVVAAAFPKGTLAVWLRDALGEVFSDELFAEAFPADGRPAISPGALAAVSVLQYADNLSDRQAAEAVRARMEFVGEVLRTALEALAAAYPSWLEEVLAGQEERWLRRYGERIDSWHGDLPGADREQWLRQVGEDGFFLLEKIEDAKAPAWLPLIPALAALRRCWDEQYLRDEHGVQAREG
uniref:transposase n=1 Tax=Nonomuraea coxensis TaxID=404386 RepID=UPI00146E20D3